MSSGVTTESRNEPLSLKMLLSCVFNGQITLRMASTCIATQQCREQQRCQLTECRPIRSLVVSYLMFSSRSRCRQAGIAAMKAQSYCAMRCAAEHRRITRPSLKILVRDLWSVATFDMKTFAPKFRWQSFFISLAKRKQKTIHRMPMGDKWNKKRKDFHDALKTV